MARSIFLLPDGARFGAQRLSAATATRLGRADAANAASGRRAQLRRHFRLPPGAWPMAALSRQAEVGDAAGATWLRADPAWLRPDINGVRLLAHGEALELAQEDVDALLPALKPLFGDAGFLLDAPAPGRWYLRLPWEARLPAFSDPGEALGEDLFEHGAEGEGARRWRTLFNEAQIVLHQHPHNARRVAAGRLPVNALWFWGGGRLPQATATAGGEPCRRVYADDPSLRAAAAAEDRDPLPARYPGPEPQADALFDLAALSDLVALERDWLQPALQALAGRGIDGLLLDAADGRCRTLRRGQGWRFWRRPVAGLSG